jgi:hypothetical protein
LSLNVLDGWYIVGVSRDQDCDFVGSLPSQRRQVCDEGGIDALSTASDHGV